MCFFIFYEFIIECNTQVGIKWISGGGGRGEKQKGIKYLSNETFPGFLAQKTAVIQCSSWYAVDTREQKEIKNLSNKTFRVRN